MWTAVVFVGGGDYLDAEGSALDDVSDFDLGDLVKPGALQQRSGAAGSQESSLRPQLAE